ncbi:hypothetical protein MHK_006324 [Candidatus Magnetomorum sp. HK-1]|nr:hypothetical protein MHK_006324 [Candidatus Magnetomorum sp. HK-1]
MNNFVLCINNDSNPASLIIGKVYRSLPDYEAESYNMFRVIDEDTSETDGYLYAKSMFVEITIPNNAERIVFDTIAKHQNIQRENVCMDCGI